MQKQKRILLQVRNGRWALDLEERIAEEWRIVKTIISGLRRHDAIDQALEYVSARQGEVYLELPSRR